MIEEAKATIKEIQYRRFLKRMFEPRKDFVERSRAAFLAEVSKRQVVPSSTWRTVSMHVFRYAIAIGVVMFMGTSGLVAYADYRDVPVESPLYSLKRIGEQARLAVTPAEREVAIYESLAQRRASEFIAVGIKKNLIDDMSAEQVRSVVAKENKLRADFRKNVQVMAEKSITKTGSALRMMGEDDLCSVVEVVEKNSGNAKPEAYKKFEEQCKDLLQSKDAAIKIATTTLESATQISDDPQKVKGSNAHRVKKLEAE